MVSDQTAETLKAALREVELPPDEVMAVLDSAFPTATLPAGSRTVDLEIKRGEVALRATFGRAGGLTYDIGDHLTEEKAAEVVERLQAAVNGVPTRWIGVYFASLPVTTYWRYEDLWQIRPVPADAPRPEYLGVPHPFLIEVVGTTVERIPFLDHLRSSKCLRQIELLCSLLLYGGVDAADSSTHVWVYEKSESLRSSLRQTGYAFDIPRDATELSDVSCLTRMPEVDDQTYFSRLGVRPGETMEAPEVMRTVPDRFERLRPDDRARLLRSAYWFSRSRRVWPTSTSLSYISIINSLEVLGEPQVADPCPTCGLDRAPGPTARFRNLVEQYAGDVPDRTDLYRLRSSLVHGRHLLGADTPDRIWLHPDEASERDRHDVAERVARIVILGWLRSRPTM
jgi:hypothetical protein